MGIKLANKFYNIKRRMGELLRVQEIGDPARRFGRRLTKRKIIYKC